jgi:hypothetical protein
MKKLSRSVITQTEEKQSCKADTTDCISPTSCMDNMGSGKYFTEVFCIIHNVLVYYVNKVAVISLL